MFASTPVAPLLIGYDGSSDAHVAIRHAGSLFGSREAVVLTIWQSAASTHTYAWPAVTHMPEVGPIDAARERIAEDTAREGAAIATGAGLTATTVVRRAPGSIAEVILTCAAEFDAAAVVLGSRGRSGIESLVLGSVSTAVVHHVSRPVLVVRDAAGEARADAPIVLCCDGSNDAGRAIEKAGSLLATRPAIVLTAWQHAHTTPAYGWPGGDAVPYIEALDAGARDGAERSAAEGVQLAQAAGLRPKPEVVGASGPLWPAILDAGNRHGAGAIVLGPRGLGRLRSLMLGSVSANVLHHASRPVLVVPPDAGRSAANSAIR